MNKEFSLNSPQLTSFLLNAKHEIQVWGRGTGKSNCLGLKIDRNVKYLPRSSGVITGKTFTQLLGVTLPSTISFLERIGYRRDKDFFIGRKPPKSYGWTLPYEAPINFDHYMIFGSKKGAVGFHLSSQDRQGMSRGLNTDFEITDETLLINKERYDKEIHATNRGNLDRFTAHFHHGSHHCTSMPYGAGGKWILEAGEYYEKERGIRLFDIWNKVCKMQLDLLSIDDPAEFAAHWNEIGRIRSKIQPFVATGVNLDGTKNPYKGTLFTLANAFDNIRLLGMSYIRDQYAKSSPLIFAVEVMNMMLDRVEDAYYHMDDELHVYHHATDHSYVDSLDYDFERLSKRNSRFDADVDRNAPLWVVFDFNARITNMLVNQVNSLVAADGEETFNIINEFYSKPSQGAVMIDEIVDSFCDYYRYHQDKTVVLVRDKYGDEGRANSSQTYNEQVIWRFYKLGWNVIIEDYPGKEPPHHEKYLLLSNLFSGKLGYYQLKVNGQNCKNLVVALNNAKVIEKDGHFAKDKRSEAASSGIAPEYATHFTDAFDKIIWVRYHRWKEPSAPIIPIRIHSRNR